MTSRLEAKKLRIASSKKTQKPADSSMIVGKDILELVSGGMYVDPMAMVREYIQNAVDAIDEASREKKYKAIDAQIRLITNVEDRSIIIRDNGSGISSKEFERAMVSVGASQKLDTDARGFRGVGRFAGLSYCRELIFRTSYSGESTISEIKWDGIQFKRLVNDRNYKGDLKTFLKEISEVSFNESALKKDHFFEVELRGVIRYKNDRLLNEGELYDYLSQHAPVPFNPEFRFATEIEEFLTDKKVYSAYEIILEDCGETRTVYRPYQDAFNLSEHSQDKFQEVEYIEVEGYQGGVAAVGWILHHNYLGLIPASELIRGLRVREGNIQIGQSDILNSAFPEPRFNSWSVGELHIVHRQLTPTGRRDDFEVNPRYADFVNRVATFGKKIAKICRQKSSIRNKFKEFETEKEKIKVNRQVLSQGVVTRKFVQGVEKSIAVSLDRMSTIAESDIFTPKQQSELFSIIDKLSSVKGSTQSREIEANPLDSLPEQKRRNYQNVFDLIYECSPNRVVAQGLIDRILLRLP